MCRYEVNLVPHEGVPEGSKLSMTGSHPTPFYYDDVWSSSLSFRQVAPGSPLQKGFDHAGTEGSFQSLHPVFGQPR